MGSKPSNIFHSAGSLTEIFVILKKRMLFFFDLRKEMPRYNASEQTFLGVGMCGIVVTDGKNRVRKIAKRDYYIHPYLFPWEYCVAMVIKSPHIIPVIKGSNLKLIVKLYFQVENIFFLNSF